MRSDTPTVEAEEARAWVTRPDPDQIRLYGYDLAPDHHNDDDAADCGEPPF